MSKRKEWQLFVINIFLNKFQNINKRTKNHKWFFLYSPDIDYENLDCFLEHKFQITLQTSEFKAPYEGNQAK